MKKHATGEVTLSSFQLHAVRLNHLECRRLENHVDRMQDDLKSQLARLQRQSQGLRYHFTNVVRVLKPNRGYQAWKQAHAREISRHKTNDYIKTVKSSSSTVSTGTKATRPLLLLVDHKIKPTLEPPLIDFEKNLRRPRTSPNPPFLSKSHRSNPLLNVLTKKSFSREQTFQSQSNLTLPSLVTSTSVDSSPMPSTKKSKTPNLDTLYRLALQNQTAYQAVEREHVEKRKLKDKDFASRHRAMVASVRSSGLIN